MPKSKTVEREEKMQKMKSKKEPDNSLRKAPRSSEKTNMKSKKEPDDSETPKPKRARSETRTMPRLSDKPNMKRKSEPEDSETPKPKRGRSKTRKMATASSERDTPAKSSMMSESDDRHSQASGRAASYKGGKILLKKAIKEWKNPSDFTYTAMRNLNLGCCYSSPMLSHFPMFGTDPIQFCLVEILTSGRFVSCQHNLSTRPMRNGYMGW